MLYNKRNCRKINDKKVLHKVGKHWVILSVALLSLLVGGAYSYTSASANTTQGNGVKSVQMNHSANYLKNSIMGSSSVATHSSAAAQPQQSSASSASSQSTKSTKQFSVAAPVELTHAATTSGGSDAIKAFNQANGNKGLDENPADNYNNQTNNSGADSMVKSTIKLQGDNGQISLTSASSGQSTQYKSDYNTALASMALRDAEAGRWNAKDLNNDNTYTAFNQDTQNANSTNPYTQGYEGAVDAMHQIAKDQYNSSENTLTSAPSHSHFYTDNYNSIIKQYANGVAYVNTMLDFDHAFQNAYAQGKLNTIKFTNDTFEHNGAVDQPGGNNGGVGSKDLVVDGQNHISDMSTMHISPGNNGNVHLTIQNFRKLYGNDIYGPINEWNDSVNSALVTYRNINYEGSQLTHSNGVKTEIDGVVNVHTEVGYTSAYQQIGADASQQNFEVKQMTIDPNATLNAIDDSGNCIEVDGGAFNVGKNAKVNITATHQHPNVADNVSNQAQTALWIKPGGAVNLANNSVVNITADGSANALNDSGAINANGGQLNITENGNNTNPVNPVIISGNVSVFNNGAFNYYGKNVTGGRIISLTGSLHLSQKGNMSLIDDTPLPGTNLLYNTGDVEIINPGKNVILGFVNDPDHNGNLFNNPLNVYSVVAHEGFGANSEGVKAANVPALNGAAPVYSIELQNGKDAVITDPNNLASPKDLGSGTKSDNATAIAFTTAPSISFDKIYKGNTNNKAGFYFNPNTISGMLNFSHPNNDAPIYVRVNVNGHVEPSANLINALTNHNIANATGNKVNSDASRQGSGTVANQYNLEFVPVGNNQYQEYNYKGKVGTPVTAVKTGEDQTGAPIYQLPFTYQSPFTTNGSDMNKNGAYIKTTVHYGVNITEEQLYNNHNNIYLHSANLNPNDKDSQDDENTNPAGDLIIDSNTTIGNKSNQNGGGNENSNIINNVNNDKNNTANDQNQSKKFNGQPASSVASSGTNVVNNDSNKASGFHNTSAQSSMNSLSNDVKSASSRAASDSSAIASANSKISSDASDASKQASAASSASAANNTNALNSANSAANSDNNEASNELNIDSNANNNANNASSSANSDANAANSIINSLSNSAAHSSGNSLSSASNQAKNANNNVNSAANSINSDSSSASNSNNSIKSDSNSVNSDSNAAKKYYPNSSGENALNSDSNDAKLDSNDASNEINSENSASNQAKNDSQQASNDESKASSAAKAGNLPDAIKYASSASNINNDIQSANNNASSASNQVQNDQSKAANDSRNASNVLNSMSNSAGHNVVPSANSASSSASSNGNNISSDSNNVSNDSNSAKNRYPENSSGNNELNSDNNAANNANSDASAVNNVIKSDSNRINSDQSKANSDASNAANNASKAKSYANKHDSSDANKYNSSANSEASAASSANSDASSVNNNINSESNRVQSDSSIASSANSDANNVINSMSNSANNKSIAGYVKSTASNNSNVQSDSNNIASDSNDVNSDSISAINSVSDNNGDHNSQINSDENTINSDSGDLQSQSNRIKSDSNRANSDNNRAANDANLASSADAHNEVSSANSYKSDASKAASDASSANSDASEATNRANSDASNAASASNDINSILNSNNNIPYIPYVPNNPTPTPNPVPNNNHIIINPVKPQPTPQPNHHHNHKNVLKTNRGYHIDPNNRNHIIYRHHSQAVHFHNNGKNTIDVHGKQIVVSTNVPTNNVDSGIIAEIDHLNSHHTLKHLSSINKLRINQVAYVKGHKVARVNVPSYYRYFLVKNHVLAHIFMKDVGHRTNHRQLLHAKRQTFHIRGIYVIQNHHRNYVRFLVNIHHHNYYVTGNQNFVENAYVQKHDIKPSMHHLKVTKLCYEHSSKYYTLDNRTRTDRVGTVVRFKKVFSINKHNQSLTRFRLANGAYLTSNKNYIKVF